LRSLVFSEYKRDNNMKVSNIMMKKEIEVLQGKIDNQNKNLEKINSINEVLKDKVTLLNYSDKITLIRSILAGI
jgi:hypothetical protein